MAGLYLAAEEGRDFGTEIVFTYGPLGFLAWPSLWNGDLAVLAFLYCSAIYIGFVCTLVWILSRNLGKVGAAALAFVYLATAPDFEQLPLVIAVAWALVALQEEKRPPFAIPMLVYGGAALAALECVVKLSLGPPIVLIIVLGLLGARVSRRQWLTFAGVFAAVFLVLWVVTSQSIGAIPDYVINSQQIITGFNEAQGLRLAENWEAWAIVLVSLGLVAGAVAAGFRETRARWCAIGLVGIASFVVFKYGIVRFEPNHLAIAFQTALAIWLVIPWAHRRTGLLLVGAVVIGFVSIHAYPQPPARFDVIQNLTAFKEGVETLTSPGRRSEIADQARTAMQETYGLDERSLELIGDRGVQVDPVEIGVIWAYGLNWSPLPVFQNYQASTTKLDELNADEVENPDGPEIILRANPAAIGAGGTRGFEGRHPAWDPPAQNLATVCNFAPLRTTPRWQLLQRTGDRCGPPRLIDSTEGGPGTVVPVPTAGPGELVYVRIHGVEPKGLEKIRSFLWRPRFRYAFLNEDSVEYRLVPGTTDDGMMVSPSPGLDSTGPFAQIPAVTNIRLEGVEAPVEFDFYSVRVSPPPSRTAGETGKNG